MARLNEPPPPAAESIDGLKRRFVRQNREIARFVVAATMSGLIDKRRANSTQSVRIRTLECENASLREQIIMLQHEAERSASKSMQESVDTVKSGLEAKLAELGALVKDLGCVQRSTEKQRAQKRRSGNMSSPNQRIWKNRLTLSEAVGGADGRLPPIMEDKYYPRRTMSAEELLGLTTDPANLTDSPDLGPPPVAHFEEGDPIKFDHSQNQSSRLELAIDEENPVLSANLETRKKRRESSHSQGLGVDKAWTDVARIVSSIETGTGQPARSGAKRKLDVREEEDPSEGTCIQETEDFEYSRRTSDMRRLDTATSKPIKNKASKLSESKISQTALSSKQHRREKSADLPTAGVNNTRRALGPKSVNTDTMNSPLRSSKSNGKDKVADAKDDLSRIVRERSRSKAKPQPKGIGQFKEKEVPATNMTVSAVEKPIEPSPETPAPQPNDLFSPISTEPSAPRGDSRDTPPPPDLGPDTGTGSFGRGSRRPRGAVNYAQPNLRDKMRRPTAELVDAVAAEERARQARTAIAESQQAKLVTIKQEDLSDGLPVWKTNEPNDGRQREEPISPLGYRTEMLSNELPSSVITDRRRRTIAPSRNNEENKPIEPCSGAASAIAALTAGSKRPKINKPRSGKAGDEFTYEAAERTSIYDFTGSSPNISDDIEDPGGNDGGNKPSRSSRRHSSIPASSDQGRGSLSISRRAERERRRESALDARHNESVEKAPAPSVARTRGVVLDPGAGDGAEVPMTMGRNERAASRRRSMML